MIVVTGGVAAGKKSFCERQFHKKEGEDWCDAGSVSIEELMRADWIYNLHQLVHRAVLGEISWEMLEMLEHALTAQTQSHPVVVTDEIGCGIVPMDASERAWREAVGRLACRLAENAREVWLVTCGIGTCIRREER